MTISGLRMIDKWRMYKNFVKLLAPFTIMKSNSQQYLPQLATWIQIVGKTTLQYVQEIPLCKYHRMSDFLHIDAEL